MLVEEALQKGHTGLSAELSACSSKSWRIAPHLPESTYLDDGFSRFHSVSPRNNTWFVKRLQHDSEVKTGAATIESSWDGNAV